MDATTSEIHSYPVRPKGFAEPLFLTGTHRKEIAEHLAASPWLWKASEADSLGGKVEEPVEVAHREGSDGYRVEVRRSPQRRSKGWARHRVSGVVERWREVDRWWSAGEHLDRYVFRVCLEGGAVVDLALDRARRGWSIAGVVD